MSNVQCFFYHFPKSSAFGHPRFRKNSDDLRSMRHDTHGKEESWNWGAAFHMNHSQQAGQMAFTGTREEQPEQNEHNPEILLFRVLILSVEGRTTDRRTDSESWM